MAQQILTVDVNDGEGWLAIDRLVWPDGTLFSETTSGAYGIDDVSLAVYDEDGPDPTTAVYTATLAVATTGNFPPTGMIGVLYDALQTGAIWTIDATGANFIHWILPTAFVREGGHTYRAEYRFNPDSANIFGAAMWARRYRVQAMVTV